MTDPDGVLQPVFSSSAIVTIKGIRYIGLVFTMKRTEENRRSYRQYVRLEADRTEIR